MSNQALKGKVVVVGTGAKNLGGLISRSFGAYGASVVVHYNSDSTKASADETVKAVQAAGGDAFAIQGDLTKVSEVIRLFDEAVKRYGRLDIAVNTVGKVLKKPRLSKPPRKNMTPCLPLMRRRRISLSMKLASR